MENRYNPAEIEPKWQAYWEERGTFRQYDRGELFYVLDMFPYPSGAGLHVGHPKGYIATDVVARMKQLQGKGVLHPMGWDAFGLPAEQYALKHKLHPAAAVKENISVFKEQLRKIGFTYDWEREINTTDPDYYRWTQWIFLQMWKAGLAYVSHEPINWCPSCKTGLANEDLEQGKCERCGSVVEKRPLRQWVLRMTDYADRLLADLDVSSQPRHYLLLHGYTGSPQTNFHDWLRAELEARGHTVEVPALPNSSDPTPMEQVEYVLSRCRIDESTVILGHSLGAVVAMKVVEALAHRVEKLILVAGFAEPTFRDRKRPFEEKFDWHFDFAKIKQNAKRIDVLSAKNDSAVGLEHGQFLRAKLGGRLIEFHASEDHVCGSQEPSVLEAALAIGGLDWPEPIKEQQRHWIGRSEGVEIRFPLCFTYNEGANEHRGPEGERAHLPVFTTRVDTLYGVTYVVLAPEHRWVTLALRDDHDVLANKEEVRAYVEQAKQKSEIERTDASQEKTGVRLEGVVAINPATQEEIPLYVADYVLAGYGTGAIMAVPAHDERDHAFAVKFGLPIRTVIEECEVTEGDRDDAYRPDEPAQQRHNVAVALYDPRQDAYLAISWKAFDMRGVVTGGIEDGDSIEAAARKEILEETGYRNVKLVGIPEATKHTRFYHRGKRVNRHAVWSFALFELVDEARQEMSAEDQAQHELVWVKRTEAKQYFTVAEARWAIELFEEPQGRAVTADGLLVQSGEWNGLSSALARSQMVAWLEKEGHGQARVHYRMRDWTFSRQRYWGEPIPLIHCEKCGVVPVPEDQLPVKLPEVESYEPNDSGESPLANIPDWVNVACPQCGGPGKRETNTMPQWAGSCWYYLRYIDPQNNEALVGKAAEQKLMPVDVYVGGAEHATRHLLYARFWHKFLFDQGIVSTTEPFLRLWNVGLILASDGRKMSKRWGNVINPDEMVAEFGADAFRVYEMFMGPFTQAIPWNTDGVTGARRFLEKVWKLQGRMKEHEAGIKNQELGSLLHRTIQKVTEDIEGFRFNTAVSSLMILANAFEKEEEISPTLYSQFLILLSPFAPHIAEELWERLGHTESIFLSVWPAWDTTKAVAHEATIVVQVNGKVRERFTASPEASEESLKEQALAMERIQQELAGRDVKKVIVVPGKLVSIVL